MMIIAKDVLRFICLSYKYSIDKTSKVSPGSRFFTIGNIKLLLEFIIIRVLQLLNNSSPDTILIIIRNRAPHYQQNLLRNC